MTRKKRIEIHDHIEINYKVFILFRRISFSKQFNIVECAGLVILEIEFSVHQPDTEQEAAHAIYQTFSYFYGLPLVVVCQRSASCWFCCWISL